MNSFVFNLRLLFILVVITLAFTNCALIDPCGTSKSEFLDKFEELLDHSKQRAESKSVSWDDLDKRYETLYEECFSQWEPELNLKEKAKVASWVVQFQYYRHGKKMIDDLLE
jgi:hypothetical protein